MIRIYFAIIFLDINFHKYSSPTRIKILGVMFVVCPQYCLPTGVPHSFPLFYFFLKLNFFFAVRISLNFCIIFTIVLVNFCFKPLVSPGHKLIL